MKITTTHDRTWTVRRRWLPWERKLKGIMDSAPDVGWSSLGDDPISLIIGLVLLIVMLPFLLLLLLGLVEMLVGLVLVPLLLLLRPLLRVPWTIEIRDGGRFGSVVRTERVRGWKASRARIRELAGHARGWATVGDAQQPGATRPTAPVDPHGRAV